MIECQPNDAASNTGFDFDSLPDLVVVDLESAAESKMRKIREFRGSRGNRRIPILGVMKFAKNGLNIPMLRAHGIVGLIDYNSDPDAVARRIDSLFRSLAETRLYERVPCFLPIEVSSESYAGNEYALDISTSGVRVTIDDRAELNTDLEMRFRLPMVSGQWIDVTGRVVHRIDKRNSAGRYEVGVFFYSLAKDSQMIVGREIERLLAD